MCNNVLSLSGSWSTDIKLDWGRRSAICLVGVSLLVHSDFGPVVSLFGVLILEIVSGRSSAKPSWGGTQKLLLEWVNDKELTAPGFFQDPDSPSGGPSSMKGSYGDSTGYQMSSVPVRITEVIPR
ncbi:hypothetical protein D5086_022251 [Populus alba]|uniref:Uncharacterized protein n=1 Tax=Populus alba TaxID=43335 RepID=A0ACC4BEH3_POPAL